MEESKQNEKRVAKSMSEIIKFVKTFEEILSAFTKKKYFTFFFRGQSDSEYKLTPSIFREKNKKLLENEVGMNMEMLRKHPKIEGKYLDNNIISLLVCQHFGLPTRLLDWTLDLSVAVFFSCISNKNEDGRVFIYLPINEIYFASSIRTSSSLPESMINLFGTAFNSNIKIENSEKFYPFKTEYIFKNQDIQSSVFTIHKNWDRIDDNETFFHIDIDKDYKDSILRELELMNKNHSTIIDDKTSIAKDLKRHFKNM